VLDKIKAEVKELKAEVKELKAEVKELKAEVKELNGEFEAIAQQMSEDFRCKCSALHIFYSLCSFTFFSTSWATRRSLLFDHDEYPISKGFKCIRS
jgi:multidrug resistance efflux pump